MLLPELTISEVRIAEIMLRSDGDAVLPLKAIAQEAETSEAMVVKTAKRLGFSGYKELRGALRAYKSQPHVDLHQEVTPDDTPATIVQKVFRTSIQALEETLAILDMEAFAYAAELLHRAGQRDFYGLGGSAQIARDVSHKFLRIGIRTSVFDDSPHDGDVRVAAHPRGCRRRLLPLRTNFESHRVGSDRAGQSGEHNCAHQLQVIAARRPQRRGALFDGSGILSDQRERRRPDRPA